MGRLEKKYLNVQSNHTLNEYQRYFSTLLMKGKLHCYQESEVNKLNPNRQYWKIKNEKGEWCYYELPKYIKPFDKGSAHSLKRISHRYCVRAALAIVALTAIWSITSSFVTRNTYKPNYPNNPIADLDELETYVSKYLEYKKEHPKEDLSKHFTPNEMANTAMGMALIDPESKKANVGYYRRNVVVVSHGHTTTYPPLLPQVEVDVTNAFIYKGGDSLEESVSFSSNILAPKVGRRDFYLNKDKYRVISYPGKATKKTEVTWSDNFDREYDNKEKYIEKAGKNPDSPFLYIVNDETVIPDGSSAKLNADKNGYTITINLDKVKGVAQYRKRMYYLSGKEATDFGDITLTFTTDIDMKLQTFNVTESYYIDGLLYTIGELKANYYYEDRVIDIPSPTTQFPYKDFD